MCIGKRRPREGVQELAVTAVQGLYGNFGIGGVEIFSETWRPIVFIVLSILST